MLLHQDIKCMDFETILGKYLVGAGVESGQRERGEGAGVAEERGRVGRGADGGPLGLGPRPAAEARREQRHVCVHGSAFRWQVLVRLGLRRRYISRE
jgi:hypothetical protein